MRSLMALLFAAAAVALVFFVARPIWEDITKLQNERTDVRAALSSLKDLEKLRSDLLAAYDGIPKDKLDRLGKLLPQGKSTGDILVNFENLANERGMKIAGIEFSKAEGQQAPKTSAKIKPSPAPVVSYKFNVAGTYEAMKSLVSALEKNLRIVDVQTMNFSTKKADSEITMFEISAKSYYQP